VYIHLLWLCWQEGAIPADVATLAAVTGSFPAAYFQEQVWPKLGGLFVVRADGKLVHCKVESIRDGNESFRKKRSEAGKAGAKVRWGGQLESAVDGKAVPSEWQTDGKAIAKPWPSSSSSLSSSFSGTTNTLRPSGDERVTDCTPRLLGELETLFPAEAKQAAKHVGGSTPQQEAWFNEWWLAYWLHKAKKAARMVFGKQVKTAEMFQRVMAATRAQSPEMLGREPQHRPHGSTWLTQERWEDEATQPASGKRTERDEALDKLYASIQQEGQDK
jgi:hypothetical protein